MKMLKVCRLSQKLLSCVEEDRTAVVDAMGSFEGGVGDGEERDDLSEGFVSVEALEDGKRSTRSKARSTRSRT